jgi:hypothetical protein
MSFPRHGEIYRSDESNPGRSRNAAFCQTAPGPGRQARRKARAWLIVHDEFPVGYSLAGCSPAEPASASPTAPSMPWVDSAGNRMPANGNLSLVSVPQPRGSVHIFLGLEKGDRRIFLGLGCRDERKSFWSSERWGYGNAADPFFAENASVPFS